MSIRYVVTTCGNQKSPVAAPAEDFYIGSFVAEQGKVAKVLRPTGGRIILSNKHGFMGPSHIIQGHYDSHWGYPDTMAPEDLAKQVATFTTRPGDLIVCLGAKEYARQTRRYFPQSVKILWLPQHLPDKRMGYQKRLHRAILSVGRIPSVCLKECEFTMEEALTKKVSAHSQNTKKKEAP